MTHTDAMSIAACAFLLCALPPAASQAPGRPPQKSNPSGLTGAREKTGVCMLLTRAEVEAVQGERVKEVRPNLQSSDGMLLSECLFQTDTSAKSVSVALATPIPAGPSALTPRKFWQMQFHPSGLQEEEMPAADNAAKKAKPDGEMEGGQPRFISGLGEEAYWVGNPILGTLYVLQGDCFLRISVGGVPDETVRIERSKALARAVVKRL